MIIQILLTVMAWKKGWGPKALLPLVVGVGIVLMGATSGNQLIPPIAADVLIDIVLGVMIYMKRNQSKANAQPAVAAPAVVTEASQRPAA